VSEIPNRSSTGREKARETEQYSNETYDCQVEVLIHTSIGSKKIGVEFRVAVIVEREKKKRSFGVMVDR